MKLNLFLLLCLPGLIPAAVSILQTIPHKYELIMTAMTWPDAQKYCRAKYTDLAVNISNTDWLRLKKVVASKSLTSSAWLGLYNDINSWRWSLNNVSLKNANFTYWYTGNPDNNGGNEACGVIIASGYWADALCTGLRPFICYNANFSGGAKFIGISSPYLSWTDAQAYCRAHHTDLASSLNRSDKNVLWRLRDIQGDSWLGLYRDAWKWSDGTNALNLPWVSGQPDNYGGIENCAMITNGLVSDAPCTNQYYFFCHTNFPTRSQIMRLHMKSDGSVFDPAVQSSILEQIKQKMKEHGVWQNTTVTWKVPADGNIFHKKKKDGM